MSPEKGRRDTQMATIYELRLIFSGGKRISTAARKLLSSWIKSPSQRVKSNLSIRQQPGHLSGLFLFNRNPSIDFFVFRYIPLQTLLNLFIC